MNIDLIKGFKKENFLQLSEEEKYKQIEKIISQICQDEKLNPVKINFTDDFSFIREYYDIYNDTININKNYLNNKDLSSYNLLIDLIHETRHYNQSILKQDNEIIEKYFYSSLNYRPLYIFQKTETDAFEYSWQKAEEYNKILKDSELQEAIDNDKIFFDKQFKEAMSNIKKLGWKLDINDIYQNIEQYLLETINPYENSNNFSVKYEDEHNFDIYAKIDITCINNEWCCKIETNFSNCLKINLNPEKCTICNFYRTKNEDGFCTKTNVSLNMKLKLMNYAKALINAYENIYKLKISNIDINPIDFLSKSKEHKKFLKKIDIQKEKDIYTIKNIEQNIIDQFFRNDNLDKKIENLKIINEQNISIVY